MYKFKFADVGEGLHEGVVTEIFVKVGDKVKNGEDLFTVETEKLTTEIASPVNGTIKEILIKEGATIHVGEVVFLIDDGSKNSKENQNEGTKKPSQDSSASVVGEVKVSNEELPDIFGKKHEPHLNENNKTVLNEGPLNKRLIVEEGNILTTPLARLYAKKLGVNINKVKGSGPEGRVLMKDVKRYSASLGPVSKDTENGSPRKIISLRGEIHERREERIKVKPLRKAIASTLKNSWNQVAYTSLTTEVKMSELFRHRNRVKVYAQEKYGIKVTFLSYILKAFSLSLIDFPIFNAVYDEKTSEFILKKYYNIGVAVDTPHGLMVPVIKNVNKKSILEISQEISIYAEKARSNKLTKKDMADGTFTVTNTGSAGGISAIPVIKYPELAIGAMGLIFDRALIVKDRVINVKLMYLVVAADHRWIDGADIGRFSNRVKLLLENPEWLALY